MGHPQKGKHHKRKESWHRFSEDRRFTKAERLMNRTLPPLEDGDATATSTAGGKPPG